MEMRYIVENTVNILFSVVVVPIVSLLAIILFDRVFDPGVIILIDTSSDESVSSLIAFELDTGEAAEFRIPADADFEVHSGVAVREDRLVGSHRIMRLAQSFSGVPGMVSVDGANYLEIIVIDHPAGVNIYNNEIDQDGDVFQTAVIYSIIVIIFGIIMQVLAYRQYINAKSEIEKIRKELVDVEASDKERIEKLRNEVTSASNGLAETKRSIRLLKSYSVRTVDILTRENQFFRSLFRVAVSRYGLDPLRGDKFLSYLSDAVSKAFGPRLDVSVVQGIAEEIFVEGDISSDSPALKRDQSLDEEGGAS